MWSKRTFLIVLAAWVAALFVGGVIWRSFNPPQPRSPNPERQLASRQDGYYLCLHLPRLSLGEMYRLIERRLPNDDRALALEGCREAQKR